MARLVLDPACIMLTHSVLFSIDPTKRQLGNGKVTDFVVKPGVLGDHHFLFLASTSLLASSTFNVGQQSESCVCYSLPL